MSHVIHEFACDYCTTEIKSEFETDIIKAGWIIKSDENAYEYHFCSKECKDIMFPKEK